MVYRNNTGRLGFWLHQCVLRNTLAGSKTVVSTSRNPTVYLFTYCFWKYKLYSKTWQLLDTHLFSCIMYMFVCIYPNLVTRFNSNFNMSHARNTGFLYSELSKNNRPKISKHTLWHVSVSPKIMPHNTNHRQPCGVCLFTSLPTLNTLWYVDTLAKCHILAYQIDTRGSPPRIALPRSQRPIRVWI